MLTLETNSGPSGDGDCASLTGSVFEVELVATELGVSDGGHLKAGQLEL